MNRQEWVVVGIAVVLVAGAYLLLTYPFGRREPGTGRTRSDMACIQTALLAYRNEFRGWPDGNSADILRALRGDNPSKLMFLNITDKEPTVMLDAWGTPYRIAIVSNTIVTASAGRNRTWGDSDDVEMKRTEQGGGHVR